jgi:hypothetical protein
MQSAATPKTSRPESALRHKRGARDWRALAWGFHPKDNSGPFCYF